MNPFLWLISTLIQLYIWILIANAVLSWLVAFNVVNPHNNVVRTIGEMLYRLTEPALRRSGRCCRALAGSISRR
jgi:YggT family protein